MAATHTGLVGQRYGRLEVIAETAERIHISPSRPSGRVAVRVRCRCGVERLMALNDLTSGRWTSCGRCFKRERLG